MLEPKYKLKTAAASDPVTTTEVKNNLRITGSSLDTIVAQCLSFAIEEAQAYLGRQIISATWLGYLDCFPSDNIIQITKGPVSAITSIKYYATGDSEMTTIEATDYQLDNVDLTSRILLNESFTADADKINAVEIEFVTGWANAAAVPKVIKEAIILLASEKYLHPDNLMSGKGLTRAQDLMRNYKAQKY